MRRILGRLAVVSLATVLPLAPVLAAPADPAAAPDIVLIVIDTWRWDALGANGGGRPTATPHLDALARRGFLFSRAYASSPWTLPSTASILTGQYPTVHGAYGRFRDVTPIRDRVRTLAEMLGASGYRTRAVINALFLSPVFGLNRGFEEYDYLRAEPERERRAAPSVDNALGLVATAPEDDPLFLLLHVFDPHLPYDPPPPWDALWTGTYEGPFATPFNPLRGMRSNSFAPTAEDVEFVRAIYDGEVAYTDDQVGRFLREIESMRTSRKRWIFVTSDHGEELGEHGRWEHGHAMYDELVHVPLIVVPPGGRGAEAGVIDAHVRTLDLFPTLVELAGAGGPGDVSGRSLLKRLRNPPGDDVPVYCEREHLGITSTSLRTAGHTLIVYPPPHPPELYDLASDPAEQRNIAPDRPGIVVKLRQRMRDLAGLLEDRAAALGPEGGTADLDPEMEERLRALGYLGE